MRTRTRACLAGAAVTIVTATAAAQSTHAPIWRDIAPESLSTPRSAPTAPNASDTLTNPLGSDLTRTEAQRERQRLDRLSEVDFAMTAYGRISAPRRLGTVEHAFGQYAYDEIASRRAAAELVNLPSARSTDEHFSLEDLGLDDETPDEVRRIVTVLFKGVDSGRANDYTTWAQNLSTQHLDEALAELSELVNRLENQRRLKAENQARIDQLRSSVEFRQAMGQLRAADTVASSEDPNAGTAPNKNLRGLLSQNVENADLDREALRRVLLGRINAPSEILTNLE